MAGVLTPGQHRKCMSRIRSRNTKPSVRNEHLNGALFTLNHLFLENFAVRHAVSYGESGRELNLRPKIKRNMRKISLYKNRTNQ